MTRLPRRTRTERRTVLIWSVGGLFVILLAFSAILIRHLDEARRNSVAEQQAGLESRARIASLATTTILETSAGSVTDDIVRAQRLLSRMAASGDLLGVQLGLYFVPRARTDAQSGLLVASAPTREGERPFTPLAEHSGLDVVALLRSMCRSDPPLPQPARWSYASEDRVLSLVPVATGTGCWGVVTLRPATAAAAVSLAFMPPLNLASSMTGLAAVLAIMLGTFVLFHFRHVFASLWSGAELVPVNPAAGASSHRLQLSPESLPNHGIAGRQMSPDGMDRDAIEELAHGLKTPVATIIQSLEPLRRNVDGGDPNAQRSLQIIESASRRLIDLIQAMPARAEVKIDNSSRQMAGVTDIVHSAVMGLDAPSRDVHLRVIDMTQGNAVLAGEAALLRAAMEHIVENAIDFSPPGGEICVRITAGRSLAVLAIEDEGPGAAPEVLPQIFNRYFSDRSAVPSAASHDAKGAEDTPNFGLGLWIARRNVEALRGRIFAENRRSGGLRLTISLPIVQLPDR